MCSNQSNKVINNLVEEYSKYIKTNVIPNIPQNPLKLNNNHDESII